MTEDDDISANIEWGQKKSLSDNTRMSRRINIKKVLESEAKDRKNFKATSKQIKNLPPSLKKLRTKIKDVYDEEDEDEDENEVIFHFSLEDENSSLLNALKEDEKSKLQFQKTLENQKLQQTAGKMEALLTADKMSKQVGLKGLKRKVINDGIQDIAQNDDTFNKALVRDVAAKTKIKIRPEKMSRRETADMIKGLNKLQKAATVVEQPKENLLDDFRAVHFALFFGEHNVFSTADHTAPDSDITSISAHNFHNGATFVRAGSVTQFIQGVHTSVDSSVKTDGVFCVVHIQVDGSRDTDAVYTAFCQFCHTTVRTVAADNNQRIQTQNFVDGSCLVLTFFCHHFRAACCMQDGTAQVHDIGNVFAVHFLDFAIDQTIVAFADTNDGHIMIQCCTNNSTDGSVHAGSIAATGQYTDFLNCFLFHVHSSQ